ncbi:MAG TPA: superoxide dismutase [Steroidobacteraceae bacterium]|nr:superoxide dismutase [Steroidobacteraceae bacterium]
MTAEASRQTYPFSLPDLPYADDALEPHFDAATLRIHHREHHGTYVKKLNEALATEPDLQRLTLAQLLRGVDSLPEGIRAAVRNNGGGHLNHDLFWRTLAPASASARAPRGALGDALSKEFGSFDTFRTKFSDAAARHFASGWVALAQDYATKKLKIVDLKDHEVLRSSDSTVVVILDVWEHAYYLKYQNKRPQFIAAFWNIIDWPAAEERFAGGALATAV